MKELLHVAVRPRSNQMEGTSDQLTVQPPGSRIDDKRGNNQQIREPYAGDTTESGPTLDRSVQSQRTTHDVLSSSSVTKAQRRLGKNKRLVKSEKEASGYIVKRDYGS